MQHAGVVADVDVAVAWLSLEACHAFNFFHSYFHASLSFVFCQLKLH